MNTLPMSSPRFEVTLTPDSVVRRWRLSFALLSYAAGLLLIFMLPFALLIRVLLAIIWLAQSYMEIRTFVAGSKCVRSIRCDEHGNFLVMDDCGASQVAELLSGSVAIGKAAWLRLRIEPGLDYGELLLKSHHAPQDWRRFQVLWRIGNKSIGAKPGN